MDNFFLYVAIGFCLIMVTYVARADTVEIMPGAQSAAAPVVEVIYTSRA